MDKKKNPVIDRQKMCADVMLAVVQSVMAGALGASEVSRAEIARRMGVPPSTITRMLRSNYNLTVKTLARFVHATGHRLRIEAVME